MTGVFAVDFVRFFVVLGGVLAAKKQKNPGFLGFLRVFGRFYMTVIQIINNIKQ